MKIKILVNLFMLLVISLSIPYIAAGQQRQGRPASKEEIQQRKAETEEQLKNATTDADKAMLTIKLAGLVARENFDEGMVLANDALELANRSKDTELIARAHFSCGNICLSGNRNDEALGHFKTGLPYAEEFDDPRMLDGYYYQTGIIYDKRGMYEKALEYLRKSILTLNKNNAAPELQHATRYLNIGNILNRTGKWQEAIEHFEKSADISEKLERWSMAGGAWHNVGGVWEKMGEKALADEAFAKAAQFMERSKKKAMSPPSGKLNSN